MHLFVGLIYWIYFTVSFNCSSYTDSHSFIIAFIFWVSWCIYLMSHFWILIVLLLSHFFLLHLFIKLNFTVSFNLFESVLISWCCSISYLLLAFSLLSFFFLLHLFIKLILLPHLIIQVNHWLAYFLCFQTHCFQMCHACVTFLSHFCHGVWPYIKEKVCEQMTSHA